MKLIINTTANMYNREIEFLLDNSDENIRKNLQDEFENIVLLAIMVGYDVKFAYNTTTMQMHCYFHKDNIYKYTLTFHQNKEGQFTQYSIYSSKDDFSTIYRKKNSQSFWRVLNNFKRMI